LIEQALHFNFIETLKANGQTLPPRRAMGKL